MRLKINLKGNGKFLNQAIWNSYILVNKYQLDEWSSLSTDTAKKRCVTLLKKLESADLDERILDYVNQPLENFCKSVFTEYKVNLVVLLSRITQVINW